MTLEIILTALLALPTFYLDRADSPEERRELLQPVAHAIAAASNGDRQIAAALVALGFHESGYARAVLQGRCADMPVGMRCDMDRHGRPRALGPFQQWRVACPAAWRYPDGSQASLDAAARCAAASLRMGRARCRTWRGAFSAAHGSGVCTRPTAPRRVATMRQILTRL